MHYTFPTHREQDPESALMHYRARSYDPRTGRFAQKDPLLQERTRQPYGYADLQPTMGVDPTGERTDVLNIGNSFVLVSYINIATDIGSDADEPENARKVGERLTKSIHERWNQNGFGWRITIEVNGRREKRNLYFVPWVIAVEEEARFDNVFAAYDKYWVRSGTASETAAQDRTAPGALGRFPGTAIPAPVNTIEVPVRKVPYPYWVSRWANYGIDDSNRNYAHEYGHSLGLADRYGLPGRGGPVDDPGWAASLMGRTAGTAGELDIVELGKTTLGTNVTNAVRGSAQLFTAHFTPGEILGNIFKGAGAAGLRGTMVPSLKLWKLALLCEAHA